MELVPCFCKGHTPASQTEIAVSDIVQVLQASPSLPVGARKQLHDLTAQQASCARHQDACDWPVQRTGGLGDREVLGGHFAHKWILDACKMDKDTPSISWNPGIVKCIYDIQHMIAILIITRY